MAPKINESTIEERYQYISHLFRCHNGDCENCGVCAVFKGKEPVTVYLDYIDGKKEFNEIER